MKIISWDIGIKNLAYCIIEYDMQIDNIDHTILHLPKKITHWNIINIMPDAEHCYISTCKKPVVKMCQYYGKNVCWCEKHSSFYLNLVKISSKNPDIITKPKIVKKINCSNINVDDLRMNMVRLLDLTILPLIYTEKPDYVLIENQPSLKNPKMKAIADTLYTWFLIRSIMDSKIVKSIHFISPSNKLKQYAGELMNSENKYKSTKLKSIEVVTTYFETNKIHDWHDYLKNFTKKDDLCDSLLQGFYWIDKDINQSKKKIKIKKNKILLEI